MVDTDTYSPELLSRNLPLSSNITPKSWSVRSTNMQTHIRSYCPPNLDDAVAFAEQQSGNARLGTMIHLISLRFQESRNRVLSGFLYPCMEWDMGGRRIVIWGLIASVGLVLASLLLISQSFRIVRFCVPPHPHRFKRFTTLPPFRMIMSVPQLAALPCRKAQPVSINRDPNRESLSSNGDGCLLNPLLIPRYLLVMGTTFIDTIVGGGIGSKA